MPREADRTIKLTVLVPAVDGEFLDQLSAGTNRDANDIICDAV